MKKVIPMIVRVSTSFVFNRRKSILIPAMRKNISRRDLKRISSSL